jgi:uncharacterized Zn finger protein (UPF0148 family)
MMGFEENDEWDDEYEYCSQCDNYKQQNEFGEFFCPVCEAELSDFDEMPKDE